MILDQWHMLSKMWSSHLIATLHNYAVFLLISFFILHILVQHIIL